MNLCSRISTVLCACIGISVGIAVAIWSQTTDTFTVKADASRDFVDMGLCTIVRHRSRNRTVENSVSCFEPHDREETKRDGEGSTSTSCYRDMCQDEFIFFFNNTEGEVGVMCVCVGGER